MRRYIVLILSVFLMLPQVADAAAKNGKYKAIIKTDGGTFRTPVEVVDGDVTVIHFDGAGDMNVIGGGRLKNGSAKAELQDYSEVKIKINDPSYSEKDPEEDEEEETIINSTDDEPIVDVHVKSSE